MKQINPRTVPEAVKLLKSGYRPVGGGTDLLVRRHAALKQGSCETLELFNCRNIEATRVLECRDGSLSIGSSITLSEIASFEPVPDLLRQSVLSIAAPGIRNTATLAGNICNSSPAADSLPALCVLDAEIRLDGSSGSRTIPISDFITGPGRNILAPDELVISISCKLPDSDAVTGFRKVGTRAANALSKLSIAYLMRFEDGKIIDFRLAAGACAPTVIRSREAEQLITGRSTDSVSGDHAEVLGIYEKLLRPIDDQRSTAVYRKNTALRLIDDILTI